MQLNLRNLECHTLSFGAQPGTLKTFNDAWYLYYWRTRTGRTLSLPIALSEAFPGVEKGKLTASSRINWTTHNLHRKMCICQQVFQLPRRYFVLAGCFSILAGLLVDCRSVLYIFKCSSTSLNLKFKDALQDQKGMV